MTARDEAQRHLDTILGDKQRLEYQRTRLDKRSNLYATRASGIDMQLMEVNNDIAAARSALDAAIRTENEG